MRFDGAEVALGLGVDELAERVWPARDLDDRPGDPRSAGGTSRSGRHPCGAGRSSGGIAGRSRPSSRCRVAVAQERPDPGDGVVASRRRGDERLEAEIGIRPAAGEMAGELPDDVADARGQPERRVAVEGEAVAAGDRLGRGRPVRRAPVAGRAVCLRAGRGSAAWPPRRWAGRTGRCRGRPRRTRSATSQRTNSAPRSMGSAISMRITG